MAEPADQVAAPFHVNDGEFRPFQPHDGGPCPYRPGDRVDVQFRDLRVEYDAEARFWMDRPGVAQGFWSREHPEPSKHIVRCRLAGNRFHRAGLETER